ncbi:MAG: HlyD family type I secretion periplasmic adaptor subunit [Xanthobacteraceae bacterium]
MNPDLTDVQRTLQRHVLGVVAVAIVLVLALGGWAATTEFAGAVIAPGQLVVNSNVKKVQHPSGGIVGELLVQEGQRVREGDIVARLDDTQARANLAIIVKALDENAARGAREEAERDDADRIEFPKELLARNNNPDVAKAIDGERKQFDMRRVAREGKRAQLKERIAQLREEIRGSESQIESKKKQVDWVAKELTGVQDLWSKNLIPYARLTALEREKERLEGERGQLIAAIAQAKGKITETELQILQIDQDMRSEVGKDLAEIRAKTAELVEKKVAAEDQLKRVDIRAPIDGAVFQKAVHTVGGVITTGEVLMLIVPEADALEAEVKVQPQDIDQVRLGQIAILRFPAFNQRTTPELNGEVNRVSADVAEDQKTGARYYTVRIAIPAREIERLKGLKIVPGMPVESFIQTSPRTVITFLTKPLHDQISRAFREK